MIISEEHIRKAVNESIKNFINEAFKSNQLRAWFKQHGGVKKMYDGSKVRVSQDGLGDVFDADIAYAQECQNENMAINMLRNLKRQAGNIYYTIYQANDGVCLVVGFDRRKLRTGFSWGGEHFEKKNNRIWRDERGENPANNDYRYGKAGQNRGIYSNRQYQKMLKK